MASRANSSQLPKKVAEYESFLYRLKADLAVVSRQREGLQQQMDAYADLSNNIQTLQEQGQAELTTLVNLGAEVFCQAEVPDTERLFVDIGLGFHVEFTQSEVVAFSKVKIEALKTKATKCDIQAAGIKANLKLVGEGIAELLSLPQDSALPQTGGFGR
eukprot:CAMPEP_0196586248 /NCGR_PEP_ID=MMETSP1081-20130531/53643_1 /TAXON_ID=36882 /ORGANISM="Pyramimonas amylifera, Strain CCMP720" /LENGTH=158 /DNA_ID=CAMNT_0041908063 /DNA_START=14 /DNA_END=490 /DNA_ORIENTATION=-